MATSVGDARFIAERAKWVYSNAGDSLLARRRGERLSVRAAQMHRNGISSGTAPTPDTTTRSFIKRFMAGGQSFSDKTVRALALLVGAGLVLLLVGRGLILGGAAYLLWWALVPWVGRIRIWVWAVLGAVVALVSYVTWYHTGNQPVALGEFVMGHWWRGQFFVAAVFAAWLTYAYGWLGVKPQGAGAKKPLGGFSLISDGVDDHFTDAPVGADEIAAAEHCEAEAELVENGEALSVEALPLARDTELDEDTAQDSQEMFSLIQDEPDYMDNPTWLTEEGSEDFEAAVDKVENMSTTVNDAEMAALEDYLASQDEERDLGEIDDLDQDIDIEDYEDDIEAFEASQHEGEK